MTPDYFKVLNITLKAGRTFTDADIRQAPLVMVINETLARAAYGDADPIGKRMICCEGSPDDPMWKTVVGVVGDVKGRGPGASAAGRSSTCRSCRCPMWPGRGSAARSRSSRAATIPHR